jgi:hypothetical protein
MGILLPVGVVTGDNYRNGKFSEEKYSAWSGMDIQLIQAVFRGYFITLKKQPDRYTDMFEKANHPALNTYVPRQITPGRRKK